MIREYGKQLYIYSLIGGIFAGFCFPPYGMMLGVFSLLLIFIFTIDKSKTITIGTINAYLWGVGFCLSSIYWIFFNTGATFFTRILSGCILVLFIGIYYGFLGFILLRLKIIFPKFYLWFLPFIWVFMEHLFLYPELSFPWHSLAHTALHNLKFIQIADLGGGYFVSFLIVLFNIIIYKGLLYIFKGQYKLSAILVTSLIILYASIIAYGEKKLKYFNNTYDCDSVKIGLVHPAIVASEKWNRSNFNSIVNLQLKLSKELLNRSPDIDILVWGETNFPHYFQDFPRFNTIFKQIVDSTNINFVFGALGYSSPPEDFKKYNSVFSLGRDSSQFRYDKIKLVPFGEFFPFAKYISKLNSIKLGQASFSRGDSLVLFSHNERKFYVSICYEGIFSYQTAKAVAKGSDFLVNISNDAWYENTWEPLQHNEFYKLKAIENRISIARLANRSCSSIFYPSGESIPILRKKEPQAKSISLPIKIEETYYTRYHTYIKYLFIISGSLITMLALFFSKIKKWL